MKQIQEELTEETPVVSLNPATPCFYDNTCIHPEHTCDNTPGWLFAVYVELRSDGLCRILVLCPGVVFSRWQRATWWFAFLQKSFCPFLWSKRLKYCLCITYVSLHHIDHKLITDNASAVLCLNVFLLRGCGIVLKFCSREVILSLIDTVT